jgi:hypothetical protein
MRPVDNFSAPRLAGLSISVGACRRGECVRCRDLSVGDLSVLAGNYFECWACVSTSWSSLRVSAEVFFTRSRGRSFSGAAEGRESASPSLCFVVFVRLKNLAQNLFRNASASCAGDPCWSLLNAPVPWS